METIEMLERMKRITNEIQALIGALSAESPSPLRLVAIADRIAADAVSFEDTAFGAAVELVMRTAAGFVQAPADATALANLQAAVRQYLADGLAHGNAQIALGVSPTDHHRGSII